MKLYKIFLTILCFLSVVVLFSCWPMRGGFTGHVEIKNTFAEDVVVSIDEYSVMLKPNESNTWEISFTDEVPFIENSMYQFEPLATRTATCYKSSNPKDVKTIKVIFEAGNQGDNDLNTAYYETRDFFE